MSTVKVFDLTSSASHPVYEFAEHTVPAYAVAYAYCEKNSKMSWLFSHVHASTLDNAYKELPMTYGKKSVACGDFAACMR